LFIGFPRNYLWSAGLDPVELSVHIMKQQVIISIMVAGLFGVATADPAADLAGAAKKLASAKNYSWSSSSAFGDRDARVTSGKTGSGGYTLMTFPMRENSIDVLMRNGAAAFKGEDGWQIASADAEGDENRRLRFLAGMASRYEAPTKRVSELVEGLGDLAMEEGVYSGTLNEDAAKELMAFRGRGRRGDQQEPPPITGAAGSVKIYVSDGVVTKYELTLKGNMTFNDQERDISRTTTVEFSKVGSTSFEIAEEAAGLLGK
jgi:hypothetical protein